MERNSGYIRSFIAAVPPDEVVVKLEEYMNKLKTFTDFKWVEPQQIHVTLRFLGDSEAAQIQKVDTALSRIGGVGSFLIGTKAAGAFPSLERPNVLWLGIGSGVKELDKLASRVEQAARSADYAPESRRFRAHLTLARKKKEGDMPPELKKLLQQAPRFEWCCDSFVLMKSVLMPSGPEYTKLGTYSLG